MFVMVSPAIDLPHPAIMLALTSLHTLPLALRRSRPTLTFTIVALGCVLQLLLIDVPLPSDVGFLIAIHALAGYSRYPRARYAGLAVGLLSGFLAEWDWSQHDRSVDGSVDGSIAGAVMLSITALVCWLWGDVGRRRREIVERLHDQNEALRRDRDQRARIAAQDERTRIAREMHDIVAHSLSVVVVQADGAAYVAQHSGAWGREQAVAALTTIADTARQALAETRQLVGVLRAAPAEEPGTIEYAPIDTLAALPELVERVRGSGPRVRFAMEPGLAEPGRLPTETSLAAYRIVQESLTNVIKHAGPSASVDVGLRSTGGTLTIEVTDDGRGVAATSDGVGHGLIGMRERAESVGGRFVAGPRSEGGFRVTATLPDRAPYRKEIRAS